MRDMSSVIGGARSAKSIVNACSSGGVVLQGIGLDSARQIYCGAVTANTWKTVLSVSSGGFVEWISAAQTDSTSRTIGLRVTIDGTVVFSATAPTAGGNGWGILAVGGYKSGNSNLYQLGYVEFGSSLLVEVQSSITESDRVATYIHYGSR